MGSSRCCPRVCAGAVAMTVGFCVARGSAVGVFLGGGDRGGVARGCGFGSASGRRQPPAAACAFSFVNAAGSSFVQGQVPCR